MYWKAQLDPNPITPFVSEYIERQRLRKIGFTSSFDDLPHIKSDIFIMISEKIDKIEQQELKKKKKKK